jgi:trans-aconitate 2-methyltransferase
MARRTTDWDAKSYDRLANPQEKWGRVVLERMDLRGDETVLDAGCGSGRVTRLLLERLPRGRVIGVDGSPSMVATASEALATYGDRVSFITSDLLELEPGQLAAAAGASSVDAVFSNATFHWMSDHERLFARLFEVLRPGGLLAAQCGGTGNVQEWVDAVSRAAARPRFAEHVGGFVPWHFYGLEETERRLRAAGFERVRCWFAGAREEPKDPRNWVAVVGLAAHHERLPEAEREPFTDAVMDELPKPVVFDYIRLNVNAVRPDG